MARRLLDNDVFIRLCRARDYLHAHHAEPLSLAGLASQAAISPYHFLRIFREAFGATPHKYLIDVRIERAKALLAVGHGSVTDVCLDVGFSESRAVGSERVRRAGATREN